MPRKNRQVGLEVPPHLAIQSLGGPDHIKDAAEQRSWDRIL